MRRLSRWACGSAAAVSAVSCLALCYLCYVWACDPSYRGEAMLWGGEGGGKYGHRCGGTLRWGGGAVHLV